MANKVPARKGVRKVVLDMYHNHSPAEFVQWVKNMYTLGEWDVLVACFRFGNNKKMKETVKSLRKRLGWQRRFVNTSVINFDLPSGYTCGKADICRTYARRTTGYLKQVGAVKCFAAKMEALSPGTRTNAWINWLALKTLIELGVSAREIAYMLDDAQKAQFPHAEFIRIHAGGDFWNSDTYYQVVNWWSLLLPLETSAIYGYSKYLRYVLPEKYGLEPREPGFHLVYSWGGLDDDAARQAKRAGWQFGSNAIRRYDGEYDYLPTACTPDDPGDDIFYILAEQDFAINIH